MFVNISELPENAALPERSITGVGATQDSPLEKRPLSESQSAQPISSKNMEFG